MTTDLHETKLTHIEGVFSTNTPIYVVSSKRGTIVATSPALQQKRRDLYEKVREANLQPDQAARVRSAKLTIKRIRPSQLSQEQREGLCPPGLVGEARRLFIEEGMTLNDQQVQAQMHSTLRKIETRQAAQAQEPVDEDAPRFGVRHLVKATKLSPRVIRQFLRDKGIGRRDGNYLFTKAEAEKIGRAINKYYESEVT